MDKTGFVIANDFGQMGQKSDDVMFRDGFDFIDPGNIEFNILCLPNGFGVFFWDHAQFGHGVTGMGLDLVPNAEFGFWGPDGDHIGSGVSRDHCARLCDFVLYGLACKLSAR